MADDPHDLADPLGQARDRIVAAADPLFYGRGIAAVSVDDIREASGVPLKTLYRAFRSKDDIVVAYLSRRDLAWYRALTGYVEARSTDPAEQLALVFAGHRAYLAGADAFRGCAFQQAYAELSASMPAAAGIAREHKGRVREFLRGRAAAAGAADPDQLATQLLALSEGTLAVGALTGDPAVADAAGAAARVLISAAVAAGGAAPQRRGRT